MTKALTIEWQNTITVDEEKSEEEEANEMMDASAGGPAVVKNVIEAMKEKGVKCLAVITSIGTGDSEGQAPFFFKSTCVVDACLYNSHTLVIHILFFVCSSHDDSYDFQ